MDNDNKNRDVIEFLYRQAMHEVIYLRRLDKNRHVKIDLINRYKATQCKARFNITHVSNKVK